MREMFPGGSLADDFHLGVGWFGPWRHAYVRAPGTAVTVAGLPMIRDTARLGPFRYRRVRSQTNTHSVRFDAPASAPIADLPAAAAALGPADLIAIDYVAEGSRLLAAARRWTSHRVAVDAMARVPVTDCRAGFAQWLASRSKRDRTRWPRLERKLIAEMGIRFELAQARGGDLNALLGAIFALEASGWKGFDGTAIRDDASDTRFYTELAHAAAAADALRIAILADGDRIIAFEYAILSGDRLFVLKAAYDESYASHSIGHVLAMLHIRHCCDDAAIAWYDVLGNGLTPAAHKLRFADRQEMLYRIRIYGRGPRATLIRLGDDARRTARRVRDRWRRRP